MHSKPANLSLTAEFQSTLELKGSRALPAAWAAAQCGFGFLLNTEKAEAETRGVGSNRADEV
jgi:hypothetical protein